MGTESHGSDYIWLARRSRFFLGFLKTAGLKDSRAAECDIVKLTNGEARLFGFEAFPEGSPPFHNTLNSERRSPVKAKNSVKLYLTLALLALALVSVGCATAPMYERFAAPPLGSTYTLLLSEAGSFGSGATQITMKIAERMWEGKRMTAYVSPTGVTLTTADGAFAAILGPDDKPILSFEPPIGYEYPLEVGKTWSKSYRVTVHATKQTIPFDATWKVEAYEESLTVAAGTFKVFKISYSDTLGTETVTWSSPEVGMWIKRVETRTAKHASGAGWREIQLTRQDIAK